MDDGVSKFDVAKKLRSWLFEFALVLGVGSVLALFGLVMALASRSIILSAFFLFILALNVFFFLTKLWKRFKYLNDKYFSGGNKNNQGDELL